MMTGVSVESSKKKNIALKMRGLWGCVEERRGPVNLQRALMIWGSKIWGCGVHLYTTPTLIVPCGIHISFNIGSATARRFSTDPGILIQHIPRHLCTLLPAALESEAFGA